LLGSSNCTTITLSSIVLSLRVVGAC